MNNSAEIFEIGLGLTSPWFVEKVSFESVNDIKELHIHIDFQKGYKFKDEKENELATHDTMQRTWQHLNFFQHKCFLHARVPRVKDLHGKVNIVSVPWARKGSGFTLLFEAYSMLLIESEMPVSKASKIMDVYPQRVWNIFDYWISIAFKEDIITDLTKIGFDETSTKKGHNYVTTLVDLEQKSVLFATKGKDSETIEKAVAYLTHKNVDIQNIHKACIDMSPAFYIRM